jgi:hypothetical protein
MKLETFKQCLETSYASLEHKAFSVTIWHTGVRKSEAYERVVGDVKVEPDVVIIDFHKRKKGGDEVPPLRIPRSFYGVEEYLVPWILEAKQLKPRRKRMIFQVSTGETKTTPKGKVVTVKKTNSRIEKANWLFLYIASHTAWQIIKRLLGPKFYPHYLRLRKLSAIARNPATNSVIHIKSVSGLKTLNAIGAYMGYDEEAADEAMRGSE